MADKTRKRQSDTAWVGPLYAAVKGRKQRRACGYISVSETGKAVASVEGCQSRIIRGQLSSLADVTATRLRRKAKR